MKPLKDILDEKTKVLLNHGIYIPMYNVYIQDYYFARFSYLASVLSAYSRKQLVFLHYLHFRSVNENLSGFEGMYTSLDTRSISSYL